MFNGVPFGCPRGIVADGYCQSMGITELVLQVVFPGARPVFLRGPLVETPEEYMFEQFLTAHPQLKDANLLGRYYSKELLETAAAREAWVEPDLQPLPDLRIYRCC